MKKCPYCFEVLSDKPLKCPHCSQYIIDELIDSDYKSGNKKRCVFCGEEILFEAKVCRHCHKWVDEVERAADDLK